MLPQDFEHYNKLVTNNNIIRRHINEVRNLLKSKPKSIETEYHKLRNRHTSESNTLHYYEKVYNKNIENRIETLYGYYKLCESKVDCNGQTINGTIFVLSPEADFLKISKQSHFDIDGFVDIEYFYEHLQNIPLPFIFIPDNSIFEYRKFSDELNVKSDGKKGFFRSEGKSYTLLWTEPFLLVNLDLGYLVEEFINDCNICCFLYGFLINKTI